jgi:DNA-binding transcriptional LysR family regulator
MARRRPWEQGDMHTLRVAFMALPVARLASLFRVLLLERPDVRLEWLRRGLPLQDVPLLGDADVALLPEPPLDDGLEALTIGVSRMVVIVAAGHPLTRLDRDLRVADVLDQPFLDGRRLHRGWRSFWTLDAYRGGPPAGVGDVDEPDAALDVLAGGDAVATFPASLADGLAHPGVVALQLVDGPPVRTMLVWRARARNDVIEHLLDIAREMFGANEPHRPSS